MNSHKPDPSKPIDTANLESMASIRRVEMEARARRVCEIVDRIRAKRECGYSIGPNQDHIDFRPNGVKFFPSEDAGALEINDAQMAREIGLALVAWADERADDDGASGANFLFAVARIRMAQEAKPHPEV